jgi:co-chaperonin GroES (HSP10)
MSKRKSNLNTSGYKVPEFRILILPEVVEEKTSGGIIIPETIKDDLQGAKTLATIVDIGEKAFDQGTDREWKEKPKVGDKVLIPSYEGYRLNKDQTKDGKEYRIILDRHILAIQTSEEICR